jgi:hypothetical protein
VPTAITAQRLRGLRLGYPIIDRIAPRLPDVKSGKAPVNTPASGMPASGMQASGIPASGRQPYSWPPFPVQHGAKSPKKVQPIADLLAAQVIVEAPWTAAPAFAATVASWAYGEGQAVLLRRYLDEHGVLDDDGSPRPAAGMLGKIESRLIRLRSELGLTPQSLGNLLRAAASVASATNDERTLEALRAEGARILRARPELTVIKGEADTDG